MAGEHPQLWRVGTKSVLVILFKCEKEVSVASMLSFIALTYSPRTNLSLFVVSRKLELQGFFLGKKNDSLYFFNARVENELILNIL